MVSVRCPHNPIEIIMRPRRLPVAPSGSSQNESIARDDSFLIGCVPVFGGHIPFFLTRIKCAHGGSNDHSPVERFS